MCVTSAAITLSGEQTVNGTAVVTGDRVLVKDQASAIANGIYVADTGAWSRAADFDGAYDVVRGTMVFSYAQLKFYYLTTASPVIGTSSLAFSQAPIDTSGASAYFATLFAAADAAALRALEGITRVDYATGAGTVDAITADFTFNWAAWDQTGLMLVQSTGANTSTTPSLTPDSLTGKTIVKGSNQALVAGDIPGADFLCLFRYDTSLDKVQLLNPALGVAPIGQAVTALGQNIGATVTLGSNALTFALKGANGSDPSGSNPVEVYFQSATITTGTATKRTVTAAANIVIPSTALVGTTSTVASRIYFGLLDNAGTLELCFWNAVTTAAHPDVALTVGRRVTGLLRVSPGHVYTSVANGVAADLAGVIYATSVRTNVRVIPIAYVDSTQATAGSWATAITRLVLIGPSTPVTGDVIQEITDQDGAVATGTTVIPMDDTIPLVSEGDTYMSATLAATMAASNIFEIDAIGNFASTVASDGFAGFVLDNNVSGATLAINAGNIVASGDQIEVIVKEQLQGAAFGLISFQVGSSAAGTTTFNGRASGRLYGGIMSSRLTLREIAA